MTFRFSRTTAVAAMCAVAGATAGIAGVAAAPSKSTSASKSAKAKKAAKNRAGARRGPGGPGFHGPGGPAVHSEAVVPNAAGDGFETVTSDAGRVVSVSGNEVTVKEGTDTATYKTVTIDLGSSPKVVRNHADAKVSDLKADDYIRIVKSPQGTFVMAEDAAFRKAEEAQHANGERGGRGHGHGPGGPGFGPPPGP
jgi:hypothetical protein